MISPSRERWMPGDWDRVAILLDEPTQYFLLAAVVVSSKHGYLGDRRPPRACGAGHRR
jgi:hypothetical protein